MVDQPLVLGFETSCDETGVGLVRGRTLLSDALATSVAEHERFGGVVPEIASRAHLEAMVPTVHRALAEAGVRAPDVDAVAVTAGPGLTGPRDAPYDFSFSGLKTAVARWVEARQRAGEPVPVADVAASFQEAVADVLTAKAVRACRDHGVDHLVLGGGVAANSRLRALAEERCAAAGIVLRVPSPRLCTDNGAMVAALGSRLVEAGVAPSAPDVGADSSLPIDVVTR